MSKYIMRLDDACEKRDIEKWNLMEDLLGRYQVKPLVGIIPDCRDPMMNQYNIDEEFWNRVNSWIDKDWTIAMHGYQHLYTTQSGGMNPVNFRSEFAGESLDVQREKIKHGYEILKNHGIEPTVFFAPSHTFDENTLQAIQTETSIRVISDTIANKLYTKHGFTFVPQQSGKVRKLPLHTITFCYHPNNMDETDFQKLEGFLKKYNKDFVPFITDLTERNENFFDKLLKLSYFLIRLIKKKTLFGKNKGI